MAGFREGKKNYAYSVLPYLRQGPCAMTTPVALGSSLSFSSLASEETDGERMGNNGILKGGGGGGGYFGGWVFPYISRNYIQLI